MADKTKVGLAQLRVGILGIVALFFIFLLIFLLTGNMKFFTKEIPLHTYISDAAALTESAPVRINGINAGKVKKVELSGETNPQRIIRVDFVVDQDMLKQIPSDSLAEVASDSLLGSTKYINISKGKSQQLVQPDSEVKALDTREFSALVQQGYTVLDSAQAILGKVEGIIGQIEVGKGTIGKLLVDETLYKSLQSTVDEVNLLAATLNSKKGSIGRIINDETLYNDIRTTLGRVDTIAQGLQEGQGSAGMLLKDPKMYNDVEASIQELHTILADINAGKGTAGQLLKDDKLAKQLSTTLDKVDLTIDKVNSGQGSIGQLLVNPQLYDAANGTTRELHELLKDFRANPKKFLRIKLALF